MTLTAIEKEVLDGLRAYHPDGDVIEIRCPAVGKYKTVNAGYYDDYEAAARDATKITNFDHQGSGKTPAVYFTIHRINPDLIARYYNRLEYNAKETTSDNDVQGFEWLPIDIDAVRPANISSSDGEHAAAIKKANDIREHLISIGWSKDAFMLADSGNGGHLVVKIKLIKNKETIDLIKKCLETLDKKFSDSKSKVDTTTFTPARIWKTPGTVVRKGDDTPARPHRIARILEKPDRLETITEEQLKALCGFEEAVPAPDWIESMSKECMTDFNPTTYAEEHGATVIKTKTWIDPEGGKWTLHVLDVCPFNSSHNRGEAWIGMREDGKRNFGCKHDSCSRNKWYELRDKWEPGWRDKRNEARQEAEQQSTVTTEHGTYTLNNRGNVARLIEMHGNDLKYVRELKEWIKWTGKNWARDETAPYSAIDDVVKGLYEEARTCLDSGTRKTLAAFAADCGNNAAYSATITLASKNPELSISVLELDSNDCIFNMQNGTLDLTNFQLFAHNPLQKLVKIVGYEYDPSAKCPRWLQFLDELFESDEIADYLRRVVGYSLTGSMAEKCFFFLYGPDGDNGKSIFLAIMRELGGEYAKNADISTFLTTKNERVRDDLAALIGARIITTAEPEEGSRFAMTVIKPWTGGDPQTCRELYGKVFTYPPKGKIFLAANNKPAIYERTNAAWARVHIIPFNKTIAKEDQDKNLVQKLKKELPGILNWAIEGLKDYHVLGGLYPPKEIQDALKLYRRENDSIKTFIEEVCVFNENESVAGPRLYSTYKEFCLNSGMKPLGLGKFNGAMLDSCTGKKVERTKTASGYVWKGISSALPFYVGK